MSVGWESLRFSCNLPIQSPFLANLRTWLVVLQATRIVSVPGKTATPTGPATLKISNFFCRILGRDRKFNFVLTDITDIEAALPLAVLSHGS